MLIEFFVLLIVFQLKHFLADYIFQGKYMLGKFKEKGWVAPLFTHVCVHGVITLIIALFFVNTFLTALFIAFLDMIIHFIMDRIKASPKLLGRYTIKQKQFWWSLGFDQMIHHLTHYFIIFILLV